MSEIIKNSINKTDVLNKLGLKNNGGNYNTLSSFINRNKLDISHFNSKISTKEKKVKTYQSIKYVLVENSSYIITSSLKKRLYKEGLKERKCELCGQEEVWNGKKMSLILDHVNGNRYDNRIENLRIVCPNCNATLETHCRGLNTKKEFYYKVRNKKCENINCDILIRKDNKFCRDCWIEIRKKNAKGRKKIIIGKKETRKVERPPHEILLKEIEELGYSGTGRKYGVSDNAIRKWVKVYEKSIG